MTIDGRSLREAVAAFRDQLNRTLTQTVTRAPLIAVDRSTTVARMALGFRSGGTFSPTRLRSRTGPLALQLAFTFDSVPVSRNRQRLRIVAYQYTLGLPDAREPFLRWEYVRAAGDPTQRWSRFHLQGPLTLPLGDGASLTLDDIHAPTGAVAPEDVLRLCIADLGVPPLGDDWHVMLEAAAARFALLLGD